MPLEILFLPKEAPLAGAAAGAVVVEQEIDALVSNAVCEPCPLDLVRERRDWPAVDLPHAISTRVSRNSDTEGSRPP
jgi:hypothetical protein